MKRLRKKRMTRRVLAAIIAASLAAIFLLAVLITDAFIPVRYFSAYCVRRDSTCPQGVEITFLDVGFGDCAFIAFPDGKNMLIDGGNGDYTNNHKVLKFLNSRGVDTVNYLVCTSVKDEHCDGLAEVVRYKNVERAFIPYCKNRRITDGYNSFITQLEKRKVSYSYASVSEGVYNEEYDYFMTFLSPIEHLNPSSEYAALNTKANSENIENASAVVWVEYGGCSVIFTSDARPAALERIIADYELSLLVGDPFCSYLGKSVQLNRCTIVTSPAHSGARNTSSVWYDYIQPEHAIVSVGKNFAEYPSIEAISDMQRYCEPLFTSYNGNITVMLSQDGYAVRVQKSSAHGKE